jgi:predicted MPP superfamily phosphohydrolase
MKKAFTILHLSDAHIGNPTYEIDLDEVVAPLLKDLAKMKSERGLSPNLVVFSGDLAYGEIETAPLVQQYEQAREWIRKIYGALGCKMSDSPFLIVPGNHDINRRSVGSDQEKWLDELSGDSGLAEVDSQMMSGGVLWRRMLDRQQEWQNFVKSMNLGWEFDPRFLMSTGYIQFGATKIGIAGLNTSWASSREREQGRLWIGKHQAQKAWANLGSCDFKIAVTHHPISWLNEAEQTWMEQKIETNFNLHLHGHIHEQWFSDSNNHLRIAAGPCYTGSNKENAYSWIEINFTDSTAFLHLREYKRKGAGGWGALEIPGKTLENGIGEVRNLFRGDSNQKSQIPSVATIPRILHLESLASLVRVLDEYYGLRWEPATFVESEEVVLYWPVRLRPTTPIHAVQSFVAAALQKKGARIVLFLDDLGNTGSSPDAFKGSAKRWFKGVGAEFDNVDVRLFSETLTPGRTEETWGMVRNWLAGNDYKLNTVLEVSKLTSGGEETKLDQLLQRRPRRLLTPPLVWACLRYLMGEFAAASVITLGGYDERVLWKAWRETVLHVGGAKVGHLYAPVLQKPLAGPVGEAVHMATTNLAWDSREDIEKALEDDRLASPDTQNWLARGRMAEWCLKGAILLPLFVRGDEAQWMVADKNISPVSDPATLREIDPQTLMREISKAVASWML